MLSGRSGRHGSPEEPERTVSDVVRVAETFDPDFGPNVRELFRRAGAVPVLLCLHTCGTSTKYGMTRILRHRVETVAKALDVLAGLGLVACEKQTCFPFREFFWLTARGTELVDRPLPEWPDLLARAIR